MPATTQPSTEAANDAANRRLADEVWSRGDLAICDELVAPGWVLHQPGVADPGRGPEGYRAWVTATRAAFPDLELVPEEQVCLGDRVATRWSIRGTHLGPLGAVPPTGRRAEWTAVSIKRFAGGKVAETWIATDRLGLLRQLGAAPGEPGPAGW